MSPDGRTVMNATGPALYFAWNSGVLMSFIESGFGKP